MNSFTLSALSASVVALSAPVALAVPSAHLLVEYTGSYAADGVTSLGVLDLSVPQSAANFHEFDLRIRMDGLASDEDLASVGFTIDEGSGLTFTSYSAVNPIVADFDGNGNPGFVYDDNIFFDSGSLGPRVLLGHSFFAANAYSRQIGEAGRPAVGDDDGLGSPTLFGKIRVQWDGTSVTELDFNWFENGEQFTIWQNNATGTASFQNGDLKSFVFADTLSSTESFAFGSNIPEPGSLALLGLSGVAMLVRRRNRRHA